MNIDWANVAVTVLVAFLTTYVTQRNYRQQDKNLERDELRRRKVEIIYRLLGSRYVLVESYQASSTEVQVFNTAIAQFPVFFGEEMKVIEAYDNFRSDKSDANLIKLLQLAASVVKLELPDSSLANVLTVNAAIPMVIIPGTIVPPGTDKKGIA